MQFPRPQLSQYHKDVYIMPQNSVEYGGIHIPGHQAQPPAGHPDIAFRPACNQVDPVLQANGLVAHTIPLPDGGLRILHEMPPMDGTQATLHLDGMGLCKIGGDTVPIVMSSQLPQRSIARVSATVSDAAPVAIASEDGGFPWFPVLLLGVPIVVGLVAFLAIYKIAYRGKTVWPPSRKPIITPPPAPPARGAGAAGDDSLIDSLFE